MNLKPYQQRVVEEKEELDEKLAKLNAFFETDTFNALEHAERDRLFRQSQAMDEYSCILGERIEAFGEEEEDASAT